MYKPESVPGIEMHKIVWDFDVQMDHLIMVRRQDEVLSNKKKNKTCHQLNFVVPMNCRVKIKKIYIYRQVLGELKILGNMEVTVIPIMAGALGTVSKAEKKYWENWKSEEESRLPKLQKIN